MPEAPRAADLLHQERIAHRVLRALVEEAGGRFDSDAARMIPVDHVDELADYLDGWARSRATTGPGGDVWNGRPGVWHALDDLYPLQDPNRWDSLRKAIIIELEARGWRRIPPPRGSAFLLPAT